MPLYPVADGLCWVFVQRLTDGMCRRLPRARAQTAPATCRRAKRWQPSSSSCSQTDTSSRSITRSGTCPVVILCPGEAAQQEFLHSSSVTSQTLLSWFHDRRHHAQKHVDWQCLVHLLASPDPSVVSVTAASIASLARLIPSVVPAACAPLLTQHLGPAAAAFVASGPQRGPERSEASSALQLDLGTLGYKLCAVVGCVRSVAAAA